MQSFHFWVPVELNTKPQFEEIDISVVLLHLFLMTFRSSSLLQNPELGAISSAVFCMASSILSIMFSSFIWKLLVVDQHWLSLSFQLSHYPNVNVSNVKRICHFWHFYYFRLLSQSIKDVIYDEMCVFHPLALALSKESRYQISRKMAFKWIKL